MTRLLAAFVALCFCASASTAQVATQSADAAVLRALDKFSGDVVDILLPARTSTQFGPLAITLTDCRYPAGNPAGNAYAGLEITDPAKGEVLFQGWMIATSPALSAMEHPRYDIWVLRCANS